VAQHVLGVVDGIAELVVVLVQVNRLHPGDLVVLSELGEIQAQLELEVLFPGLHVGAGAGGRGEDQGEGDKHRVFKNSFHKKFSKKRGSLTPIEQRGCHGAAAISA
jgi:hypothetical protein